ncbi:helix-turn-helix domain-containing protein [Bacillus sp. JJ1566]|uniref:TrmB family transcriptional regulator n=1 Tax=Bacillus sp. JJ1566 TaxID=3122961 RepID=UPI002FFE6866
MKINEIVNSLKEFGFTEYESKVYIALLRSHPSNGNIIATLSGVPAPKVYETLRKMQDREIVSSVSGGDKGNKIGYIPVSYQELLDQKRKAFSENANFLEKALEEISTISDTNWTELFTIHGYSASIDAIQSAIENSNTQILLNGWTEELKVLMETLQAAYNRGVEIVTLTFDEAELKVPWKKFTHFQIDNALRRHVGELCIVIDNEKSIIFKTLSEGEGAHAVISSHPSTVMTTSNYIRHDILVNRLTYEFKEELKNRYGEDFDKHINEF